MPLLHTNQSELSGQPCVQSQLNFHWLSAAYVLLFFRLSSYQSRSADEAPQVPTPWPACQQATAKVRRMQGCDHLWLDWQRLAAVSDCQGCTLQSLTRDLGRCCCCCGRLQVTSIQRVCSRTCNYSHAHCISRFAFQASSRGADITISHQHSCDNRTNKACQRPIPHV